MNIKSILISMLCMSSMACMAIDENKIYGEDVTVDHGTTSSSMNIYLENNVTVCSMQFDLYLPDGISIKTGRGGGFTITKGTARFDGTDHAVSSSLQTDGSIRVMITSTTNSAIQDESEEGTDIRTTEPLLALPLVIDESQASGTYDIQMKNIVLSHYANAETTKYVASDATSKLTINAAPGEEDTWKCTHIHGDVNGDGEVTIEDISELVEIVLGRKK